MIEGSHSRIVVVVSATRELCLRDAFLVVSRPTARLTTVNIKKHS